MAHVKQTGDEGKTENSVSMEYCRGATIDWQLELIVVVIQPDQKSRLYDTEYEKI